MPFHLTDQQTLELLKDLRTFWRNSELTEVIDEPDARFAVRILLHRLLSRESTDTEIQDLLD